MGASFNGRTQVSKTCNVGSIPTAPAKGVLYSHGLHPVARERRGPKPLF